MTAALAATIGLILNMIGVTFAFFWGHPQRNYSTELGIGGPVGDEHVWPNGETERQRQARIIRAGKIHLWRSRTGLALMFVGFAFQLAAIYLSPAG